MKTLDAKKIEKLLENDKVAIKKIGEFEDILNSIENLDERKLFLWLEIYNNAKKPI